MTRSKGPAEPGVDPWAAGPLSWHFLSFVDVHSVVDAQILLYSPDKLIFIKVILGNNIDVTFRNLLSNLLTAIWDKMQSSTTAALLWFKNKTLH